VCCWMDGRDDCVAEACFRMGSSCFAIIGREVEKQLVEEKLTRNMDLCH
jgi:hypothetical protein